MTLRDKGLIWLGVFVFLITSFVFLKSIMLPFVVAFIVAYFLDPVVDRMEKIGLSRTIATLMITVLFFVLFIGLLMLLIPLLYEQLIGLLTRLPEYTSSLKEVLHPVILKLLEGLGPDALEKITASLAQFSGDALAIVGKLLGNLWQSGLALVNILSLIFITPIVSFYIIRDWDHVVARIDGWLPRSSATVIRQQCRLIDRALAGYIRGQTNVCMLLGAFYAVGLMVMGLEFGLFIGIGSGLLTFIPYVGVLFGMVVGVMVAFFQFGDFAHMGIVVAIFLVGQFLEGNFVSPKLVGDSVGLHPVWIIFGLLSGAALYGFVGMLVAIPVTAMVAVLIRFGLSEYLNSSLFQLPKKPAKRKA